MILIDSIYICEGGGLVLLKYLVEEIEKENLQVYYLFDERVEKDFQFIEGNKKTVLNNSYIKRYLFYLRNKSRFSKVLCFGNVPPPIKLPSTVYVYFHQLLFLEIPNDFKLKKKCIYFLKQSIVSILKDNAKIWLVQSELVQKKLAIKYLSGNKNKVLVLPFYPPLDFNKSIIKRQANTLLYVSNSSPHKNHEVLIEAFCNIYDKLNYGKLTLTVPEVSSSLNSLIREKVGLGYPIVNSGFVDREKISILYLENEYLIFPSLTESFGLGIAEAIDGGCKVICADLPYTYEICEPSLKFNPYMIGSIEEAILIALTKKLQSSKKIINNDIFKLISILQNEEVQ